MIRHSQYEMEFNLRRRIAQYPQGYPTPFLVQTSKAVSSLIIHFEKKSTSLIHLARPPPHPHLLDPFGVILNALNFFFSIYPIIHISTLSEVCSIRIQRHPTRLLCVTVSTPVCSLRIQLHPLIFIHLDPRHPPSSNSASVSTSVRFLRIQLGFHPPQYPHPSVLYAPNYIHLYPTRLLSTTVSTSIRFLHTQLHPLISNASTFILLIFYPSQYPHPFSYVIDIAIRQPPPHFTFQVIISFLLNTSFIIFIS